MVKLLFLKTLRELGTTLAIWGDDCDGHSRVLRSIFLSENGMQYMVYLGEHGFFLNVCAQTINNDIINCLYGHSQFDTSASFILNIWSFRHGPWLWDSKVYLYVISICHFGFWGLCLIALCLLLPCPILFATWPWLSWPWFALLIMPLVLCSIWFPQLLPLMLCQQVNFHSWLFGKYLWLCNWSTPN